MISKSIVLTSSFLAMTIMFSAFATDPLRISTEDLETNLNSEGNNNKVEILNKNDTSTPIKLCKVIKKPQLYSQEINLGGVSASFKFMMMKEYIEEVYINANDTKKNDTILSEENLQTSKKESSEQEIYEKNVITDQTGDEFKKIETNPHAQDTK